jgi:hypothetical protein
LLPPLSGKTYLNSSSPFKGEVGRGMGFQLLDHQPDLLPSRFLLFENFIVPEPENPKTSCL